MAFFLSNGSPIYLSPIYISPKLVPPKQTKKNVSFKENTKTSSEHNVMTNIARCFTCSTVTYCKKCNMCGGYNCSQHLTKKTYILNGNCISQSICFYCIPL